MKNDLFRRLQMSSPHLAKEIAQDPDSMHQLTEMEAERIAVEISQLLQEEIKGLTIEQQNDRR